MKINSKHLNTKTVLTKKIWRKVEKTIRVEVSHYIIDLVEIMELLDQIRCPYWILSHYSVRFQAWWLDIFFIYCDVSTAYWGRDPTSAAAASQLFGSPFVNNLGLLSSGPGNAGNTPGSSTPERFPPSSHGHNSTMATAASQAASLAGLHSASKILWWST